jgi:hypothetical protein
MLPLLFNPEDGGSTLLGNAAELLPDYTVSHPRRHSHRWENISFCWNFLTLSDSGRTVARAKAERKRKWRICKRMRRGRKRISKRRKMLRGSRMMKQEKKNVKERENEGEEESEGRTRRNNEDGRRGGV